MIKMKQLNYKTIPFALAGMLLVCSITGCQNEQQMNEAVASQETAVASTFSPEDYRFPREEGSTKGGYPVTLSGKPIT